MRTVFHLAARFFTSLSARPPAAVDEVWAEDQFTDAELIWWRRLSNQDRRHSIAVARRFARRRPDHLPAELAGALLHDIGKATCDLGTFGRVVATLVGPRTPRFRCYLDHVAIGARLMRDAGSDPRTVELVAGEGPAAADLRACDHA